MSIAKHCLASISLLLFAAVTATAADFKLDHFKVYDVKDTKVAVTVALHGQFDKEAVKANLVALTHFANPVSKNKEPIRDKNAHLTWYRIEQEMKEPKREIEIENQFGKHRLVLGQPKFLLAPAEKKEPGSAFPKELDHFKVYEVLKGESVGKTVSLEDQFGIEGKVDVSLPKFFCVPVDKQHGDKLTKIRNGEDHLAVYEIASTSRLTLDQFGEHKLAFEPCEMLCVPSKKRIVEPPVQASLDHFKVYIVKKTEVSFPIASRGQFDKEPVKASLIALTHFANPVSKNKEPIIDKNAHLTWYQFKPAEKPEPKRLITFENQFGLQQITIGQPVYLLVPALKKEDGLDFPKGLDHFKCYEVLEGKSVEKSVDLVDQFGSSQTTARIPKYFCVPAEKIRGDILEKIQNEKDHLVFYDIGAEDAGRVISVGDQFNRPATRELSVEKSVYLGVPTVKLKVE
ncbi:MAG: hypothetical protein H7Z17_04820 [Fuerstia sp.]|nr:hypothetical protein [Fuerstiella sp.]